MLFTIGRLKGISFCGISKIAGQISNRLAKYLDYLVDFVFPPFCLVCEERMPEGERQPICSRCWRRTVLWKTGACQRCGADLMEKRQPQLCTRCLIDGWPCADIRTPGPFSGTVAEAVHLLKYSERPGIARKLAELMVDSMRDDRHYLKADLVLAVPLHPARRRERGYNQAHLLAREVARQLGLATSEKIVVRIKHTQTQTKLSRAERQENVKNIFRVRESKMVSGRRIILVDDVLTTGATLGSCAQALRTAGASEVLALTAAAAPLD